MKPPRRYDRAWGIQIGKVEGEVKGEGVGGGADAADDDTASTAELTAMDSDEEGSYSSGEEEEAERTDHARGQQPSSTGETVRWRARRQCERRG
jgi:hypothetical protein